MKSKATAPAGSYIIKEAHLKDDFCDYVFEITEGIGSGDTHKVKGSGVILEDMRKAFERLNVHLAVIDDSFKLGRVEIDDIDKYHGHEFTLLYNVTGIKVRGSRENETVILVGNKYVSSAGGRIELATPKIPMDNMSSYKWYNELNAAVEAVRDEVAAYKEGKYEAIEEEEEDDNVKQLTISDAIKEGE